MSSETTTLYLPLHYLYDHPLTAMNWLKMRMKMMLLQVVQLQHWCQKLSLHASDHVDKCVDVGAPAIMSFV